MTRSAKLRRAPDSGPAEPGMLAAAEMVPGLWYPAIVEQVDTGCAVTALRFANGNVLHDPGFCFIDRQRLVADPEALLLRLKSRYRSFDQLRVAALPGWRKFTSPEGR